MILRIHHYHHDENEILERLCSINRRLEIMSVALDNLTAAEANLETVVAAAITDIQTLAAEVAAGNTANDPAIQAIADKINGVATSLNAVVNPTPSP
jgi:serine protease inhibitor